MTCVDGRQIWRAKVAGEAGWGLDQLGIIVLVAQPRSPATLKQAYIVWVISMGHASVFMIARAKSCFSVYNNCKGLFVFANMVTEQG